MGLGQRSAKWDNTITTRTADVTTVIKPELELNTMVLELAAGAEWRPLSRHALSLEAIVPFQIGDGTLVHKIGGTVHYDASAPKSFRQSHSPRVMIGYDYRLLDRIDIGIGTSVIGADYFSETPTFTTDNGQTRTLSDPALSNHWLEYHLGWTFAL
jgi:hypothetical protein